MKISILSLLLIGMAVFSGENASGAGVSPIQESEIHKILLQQQIGDAWDIDQVQQSTDATGRKKVSVFVVHNLRKMDFGGCLADLTVLELKGTDGNWTVERHDASKVVSTIACDKVKSKQFAQTSPGISDRTLARGMRDIRQLVSGLVPAVLISYKPPDLKAVVSKIDIDTLDFVSSDKSGSMNFDFVYKDLLPRYLSVRLSYSGDVLTGVDVNTELSVEPGTP